jgi:hypothetical protein
MATTISHRWHTELLECWRAPPLLPEVASITRTDSPSVTRTLAQDIHGPVWRPGAKRQVFDVVRARLRRNLGLRATTLLKVCSPNNKLG